MDPAEIKSLLARVRNGALSVDAAVDRLRHLPFEPLGFASIDHHRGLRLGCPEVIFCEGKRPEHVRAIVRRMTAAGAPVLATRASVALYRSVKRIAKNAVYHDLARAITVSGLPRPKTAPAGHPDALVITAGTADVPVAEEARVTLDFLGIPAEPLYDVGVAGLHRLVARRDRLETAGVLIVAAGMDGALPSVVGGWTDKPVVAVPTSVGYGASLGGVAALLTMLNACAPGIAVVNIDNGFGAAVVAQRILRQRRGPERSR